MYEYVADNNSTYHSHGEPLTVMYEYVADNNSSYHSHGEPLTVMYEYVAITTAHAIPMANL